MSKFLIFISILIVSCSTNSNIVGSEGRNPYDYNVSCVDINKETSFKEIIELSNERVCNFSVVDYRRSQSEVDSLEKVFRAFKDKKSKAIVPLLEQCLSKNVLDSLQKYSKPYTFRVSTFSERTESSFS